MTYSLTKTGEIVVRGIEGSACGNEVSGKRFSYAVKVRMTSLNSHGFVVEHLDITNNVDRFFKENRINGSCERVAKAIGAITAKLAGPSFIHVTLRGAAIIEVAADAGSFIGSDTNILASTEKKKGPVKGKRSGGSGRSC